MKIGIIGCGLIGNKRARNIQKDDKILSVSKDNEASFNFNERVKFIDNETKEEITTDPWHIAKDYVKLFNQYCQTLKHGCGQNRIAKPLSGPWNQPDRYLGRIR